MAFGGDRQSQGPFLKGTESFLAALVQSAADPIIGIDPHGTVLSWNSAATAMFGHSASTMVGRSVWSIVPYTRRRDFEERLAQILDGHSLAAFPDRGRTASGTEIPLTFTMSPIRDWGEGVIAASIVARGRRVERAAGAEPSHPAISSDAASGANRRSTGPHWRGQRILVVEDEALIGLGLAATLENAGFEIVGPAMSVGEALELLAAKGCALAILDVNLGKGETSAPLAERLRELEIPFLVSSAYSREHHPPIFRDAPAFPKPFGARDLVSAVQSALA